MMQLHLLCIWWLSQCLALTINGHCLRQSLRAEAAAEVLAARHMWQPSRPATPWLADTGSCAGPTALRRTADSHVAAGNQLHGSNATVAWTAAPAVSRANYVYQCAAKRVADPSPDSTAAKAKSPSQQLRQQQQQLTVPAFVLQLANIWNGT
ncbi:uncharacterized protein [Drosophila virilis]|uniref:Secreted protein n=1 Tax=Drosophila virilis TaxID=7244 RepID=B4M4P4_DROVI|nr:uncharacterized protein LOC6632992 [Drosophila virilis]EDW59605.2 uncharacterized protein Dvir_GJ10195 [Drosophila virilis]